MKKWLLLVLMGAFIATSMVGCGKDKEKDADEPTDEPSE